MNAGTSIKHPIHNMAYTLISKREVTIEGNEVSKDDEMEVTNSSYIDITANTEAEIIVIDV